MARHWEGAAAAGPGHQAGERGGPTRVAARAEHGRIGRPGHVLSCVGARLKLIGRVHGENGHRCTTDWGQSNNDDTAHREVLGMKVLAGIKERYDLIRVRVDA
jgi:hypothetical protein